MPTMYISTDALEAIAIINADRFTKKIIQDLASHKDLTQEESQTINRKINEQWEGRILTPNFLSSLEFKNSTDEDLFKGTITMLVNMEYHIATQSNGRLTVYHAPEHPLFCKKHLANYLPQEEQK